MGQLKTSRIMKIGRTAVTGVDNGAGAVESAIFPLLLHGREDVRVEFDTLLADGATDDLEVELWESNDGVNVDFVRSQLVVVPNTITVGKRLGVSFIGSQGNYVRIRLASAGGTNTWSGFYTAYVLEKGEIQQHSEAV